jgi:putative adhesin
VATGLAGCGRIDTDGVRDRQERRFTVTGTPDVKLATFDGAVVVRGWDRDEVSVEIEKRGRDAKALEDIDIVSEQKGNAIAVDVREKSGEERHHYSIGFGNMGKSARLVVSVPTGTNLVVRTGDGGIRVEHVNGKVELRSADGGVVGRDLSGDVFAHTEDGAIRLEGVDGRCDVASDDGSIAVQGRLDGLRVSTEDGSVVVKALAGSKIAREWSLSTGDGSMVLYVPDSLGADVDAEARDGSVRFDSSLTFARSDDHGKSILRGRLGAGGPRLTLRSGDGSIRLRRLPGGMPVPPVPPVPPPTGPPPPPDVPVER